MKKILLSLVVASLLSVMAGASFTNQLTTITKPAVSQVAFLGIEIPDIWIGDVQLTGDRIG